ncbi:MAG TPA: dephospho-CoA kinase [Clostridia bacterium]|nr:dephospho-CoA kinase [Clostridia bacterium]
MKVIGLTGGIAAGKSKASSILLDLGALVIDADRIGRRILEKGSPAWKQVKDNFGEQYLLPGGEVDRRKLGELVFSHPPSLAMLNEITHPIIKESIETQINQLKAEGYEGMIVVEAALLLEKGWETITDEVWVVDAPKGHRIERIMVRDKLPREEAINRINSQMSQEEKIRRAHRVIYNKTDINNMEKQIKEIWKEVQGDKNV